jgi:alpha-L-fucosidase
VIKVENVLPAIKPVQIVTKSVIPLAGGTAILQGNIFNHKGEQGLRVKFYYRLYNGQVEDLYAGPWMRTGAVNIGNDGSFKTELKGLKKGGQYQFKAVVEYKGIQIDGDKMVWKQPE